MFNANPGILQLIKQDQLEFEFTFQRTSMQSFYKLILRYGQQCPSDIHRTAIQKDYGHFHKQQTALFHFLADDERHTR